MVWVGGTIFYVIVVISVVRLPEFSEVRLPLIQKTALQFRKISYYLFVIFFISGMFLLSYKGYLNFDSNLEFWTQGVGRMISIKVILFFLLLFSSLYHDFFTGPRTFLYAKTNHQLYEKFRKRSALFGKVNLLISILIAILGILISRGISF